MGHLWNYVFSVYLLTITGLQVESHSITKRNAFQLCHLINFYTNRSCLQYNPYGCFCGYGQTVASPVDSADRCCKEHDDCYGVVKAGNYCYFWIGLFVGYDYTCRGNDCLCTDHSKCSRKVCECDLKLAKCLGQTEYNWRYKGHDQSRCRNT